MVTVKIMAVVSALFATAIRSIYHSLRNDPQGEQESASDPDEESNLALCFRARAQPRLRFRPSPTASAWMTYYAVMAFWYEEAGPFDQLVLFASAVGYAWYNYLEFAAPVTLIFLLLRVLSAIAAVIVVAVAFVRRDGLVFVALQDVAGVQDMDFSLGVGILGEPVFWRATLWAACVRGAGGLFGAVISLFGLWIIPHMWRPAMPRTTHTALYILLPLAQKNDITDWISITATIEIASALLVMIVDELRLADTSGRDSGGTTVSSEVHRGIRACRSSISAQWNRLRNKQR
jgi:hypothetical protein